jgi:hypothetical protein
MASFIWLEPIHHIADRIALVILIEVRLEAPAARVGVSSDGLSILPRTETGSLQRVDIQMKGVHSIYHLLLPN